jgi:hypothetical protein
MLTICMSGTASHFQGSHERRFNIHVKSSQQKTSLSTFQLLFSNVWSSSSVTFWNISHCAYISVGRAHSALAFRKILYSYFTLLSACALFSDSIECNFIMSTITSWSVRVPWLMELELDWRPFLTAQWTFSLSCSSDGNPQHNRQVYLWNTIKTSKWLKDTVQLFAFLLQNVMFSHT